MPRTRINSIIQASIMPTKEGESELCSRLAPFFRAHSRFIYDAWIFRVECTMQSTVSRVSARFYVLLFCIRRTKPFKAIKFMFFRIIIRNLASGAPISAKSPMNGLRGGRKCHLWGEPKKRRQFTGYLRIDL